MDRCPVCLSVCLSETLVYCGQTVGRIKMKHGVQVRLFTGHNVLDGDPAPTLPPRKGRNPPIFGPCPLWAKGWMDYDATWYGGRPRPRRLCARWGPSSPHRSFCCQTAGWIKMPLGTEVGIGPGDFVLDVDPGVPKKGAEPPIFWPMSIVAERLDVSRCHLPGR